MTRRFTDHLANLFMPILLAIFLTGIISSATLAESDAITKFFYDKRPPPVPIKVLTKP